MPSSSALASLLPAASPATRKLVFFDTLPAALAPSASSFSFASSRPIEDSVPVRTTVLPSSGPAFVPSPAGSKARNRSEEHTSELQSLMRISYAVFCLKKKRQTQPDSTVAQQ